MAPAAAPINRPWPVPEPPDLAVPTGLRRERFRAMGTTMSLLLPAESASEAAGAIRALFATWEATLSRFRPESELSRLNARAGRAVSVSPLLYGVVETALDAARATDGLFDPTLLSQIVVQGYDRSFETLPGRQALPVHLVGPGGGWRAIVLDRLRQQITLPPGSGLDLGGIAKGMAVDASLDLLRTMGIDTALVNAGADLAVAGLPRGSDYWPVTVPLRAGTRTIALRHGALATSSIARRRWSQGGQQRHHVLDPRSGASARGNLWSVSVSAARCDQADVAAKVALILGSAEGARFLASQELSGLLVDENGATGTTGTWSIAAAEECRR